MMDAQDQVNETDPVVVIDPHGARGQPGSSVIQLTKEEQSAAVNRLAEAFSIMLAAGNPPERVLKTSYLSVIGSIVNSTFLSSVADIRAFVTGVIIPTLDRLAETEAERNAQVAQALAEQDLRDAEPAGNA